MKAFRRPIEAEEVERLAGLYEHARQAGKAYEPAVKTAQTVVAADLAGSAA